MDVKLTNKQTKNKKTGMWAAEAFRKMPEDQRTRTIPAIVLWEKRLKAIHREVINVSIIVI